ncbi:MAG: SGNH/GDSL hydrolase family protein [Acidimicrobiales bacterium]
MNWWPGRTSTKTGLVTALGVTCLGVFVLGVGLGGPPTSGEISADSPPTTASVAVVRRDVDTLCSDSSTKVPRPLAVVVGASITAGVGATTRADAWPSVLAAKMGWRVIVRGVSGAGYVARGASGGGPLIGELNSLHLLGLHPSVVILQAGHNDVGVPAPKLQSAVAATVGLVQRRAPRAKLVLVTVFPGGVPTPAQLRTNREIIATARRADVDAIVINPIAQDWRYKTLRDDLHPTDAGVRWIARRVQRDLASDGVISSASCPRPAIRGRADRSRTTT